MTEAITTLTRAATKNSIRSRWHTTKRPIVQSLSDGLWNGLSFVDVDRTSVDSARTFGLEFGEDEIAFATCSMAPEAASASETFA